VPDRLIPFIRTSIRTVWALELLLHLKNRSAESFKISDLVRDLRSSHGAISDAVDALRQANLLSESAEGVRYAPATPELDALVLHLQSTYQQRPTTVIRLIAEAPSNSLQAFADAFKIKKDKP
jgi:hypothetical protein